MQTVAVSQKTILISALIIGASFFTVPFLNEYVKQSVCSMENVSNMMYFYKHYLPTAACSAERTWDDLFELSGGVILGLVSLGFFVLSLSQRWQIGLLVSSSVASFQFMSAYMANSMGYMYTNFTSLVPLAWVIVASITFVAMLYLTPRLVNAKLPELRNVSIIYLIIVGTVMFGMVIHNFLPPEDVSNSKYSAITIAAGAVLLVAFSKKYMSSDDSITTNIDRNKKLPNSQMYA